MAHEYLITRPSGLPLDLPTMRDPSLLVYFRGESGGLIMGGYERNPAPWGLDGIPPDFNGKLLEEDWDRFEELMENAIVRVPDLEDAEVIRLVNGPEAFTPDGEFILGESDVRGFWVAAGFCAHGLAGAGGMGKLVAEWIVEGLPSLDTWEMDSRRFGRHYRSRQYTLERTVEVYSTYYDVKYPGHERQAGRPLRLSPAYPRLSELGAAFGEKSGWERPNWFEPNAAAGDESLRPGGWAGRLWSPAIGAEHRATREAAALFDETSFAKIEIAGPGAADFLEHLCDNEVARDVGAITYTQMLNERGGIECDFTVTRLAEDRFRIVTGTAFGQHDLAWIRSHAPDDGSVAVEDVTSRFACLGIWGPKSREILQPLTTESLANEDFKYMRAREVAIGPVPCLALRVTYVGELGWELYCPMEFGLRLWDTIWEAGREHGLVAGGYKAIDSCRLEKGYRVWGADITPEDTPFEAGLGFAVKLDKGEFIGRDALAAAQGKPLERKLACLVLEDPRSIALGSEPVLVDGEVVGRVTSGGYGYTVERSIAYAYLPGRRGRGRQAGRSRDLRTPGSRGSCGRTALRPRGHSHPYLTQPAQKRVNSAFPAKGRRQMSTVEGGARPDHLDDRAQLHKLGYAQELYRSMGGFQNFAISFTIISILAGCLTSYYIAFNQGGPIAITWGWLLVGGFCIIVALAMGEIASTYPDRRRSLLLGVEARRPGLGLVHRLVQPRRPDRSHGRDRLRLRGLYDLAAEPALRLPEHDPLDPLHLRGDPAHSPDWSTCSKCRSPGC